MRASPAVSLHTHSTSRVRVRTLGCACGGEHGFHGGRFLCVLAGLCELDAAGAVPPCDRETTAARVVDQRGLPTVRVMSVSNETRSVSVMFACVVRVDSDGFGTRLDAAAARFNETMAGSRIVVEIVQAEVVAVDFHTSRGGGDDSRSEGGVGGGGGGGGGIGVASYAAVLWRRVAHSNYPVVVVEMHIAAQRPMDPRAIVKTVVHGNVPAARVEECPDGASCAAMPWCKKRHGPSAAVAGGRGGGGGGASARGDAAAQWDKARLAGVASGLIAYPFYAPGACVCLRLHVRVCVCVCASAVRVYYCCLRLHGGRGALSRTDAVVDKRCWSFPPQGRWRR